MVRRNCANLTKNPTYSGCFPKEATEPVRQATELKTVRNFNTYFENKRQWFCTARTTASEITTPPW